MDPNAGPPPHDDQAAHPPAVTAVAASVLRDGRLLPRGGWEADLEFQAAAGSGFCVEDGVVGVGDRLHDREPEPDPVGKGAFVRRRTCPSPVGRPLPAFGSASVASASASWRVISSRSS